jgi:hypothetical protein
LFASLFCKTARVDKTLGHIYLTQSPRSRKELRFFLAFLAPLRENLKSPNGQYVLDQDTIFVKQCDEPQLNPISLSSSNFLQNGQRRV